MAIGADHPERAKREYWRLMIVGGGCAMCRHDPPAEWALRTRHADLARLEAHHVIPKSKLKQEGFRDFRIIWDERNGLCLCVFHHGRHTDWVQRVPREILPDGILEFVDELNLGWLLDREYP